MEVYSLEQAQESFPQLIEKLSAENLQCKITAPGGSVIVVPEEMYDNLLVTLEFLSTPGLLDRFRDINVPEAVLQD